MSEVNLANVRKWHDALLSGKYYQGSGELRSSESHFCCLGVLCDVLEPSRWSRTDLEGEILYQHRGGDSQAPSPLLMNESGIPIDGKFGRSVILRVPESLRALQGELAEWTPAIRLNDTWRFSFAEIAECIRFTWPEAFE